jgi:chemotaxis protein MotB
MDAGRGGRGVSGRSPDRRRRGHDAGHEDGERWLLTYSDMITLLMALFIIMWAVSAVNVGKFNELRESLKAAFSGKIFNQNEPAILSGEHSVLQPDGAVMQTLKMQAPQSIKPTLSEKLAAQLQDALKKQDVENLHKIKREIDAYARKHGFASRIKTTIDERGLVIRLLTDKVLFDTGEAVLKAPSLPLLGKISTLLASGRITNPIRVEGNTDDVPIATAQYPSNWELSTARATAVLEDLLKHGVRQDRLSVAGYADQRPIAPNATSAGRGLNRRVDIVVLRHRFVTPKGTP